MHFNGITFWLCNLADLNNSQRLKCVTFSRAFPDSSSCGCLERMNAEYLPSMLPFSKASGSSQAGMEQHFMLFYISLVNASFSLPTWHHRKYQIGYGERMQKRNYFTYTQPFSPSIFLIFSSNFSSSNS